RSKDNLSLSDRVFKCDNCGFSLNRDKNAAINLNNYNPATGRSVGGIKPKSLLELSKTQSNLSIDVDGKNFSEQTTLN
ncbi:MAG: zinc ribbon domain-containing protein, partial [Petrotogales bacterium]